MAAIGSTVTVTGSPLIGNLAQGGAGGAGNGAGTGGAGGAAQVEGRIATALQPWVSRDRCLASTRPPAAAAARAARPARAVLAATDWVVPFTAPVRATMDSPTYPAEPLT